MSSIEDSSPVERSPDAEVSPADSSFVKDEVTEAIMEKFPPSTVVLAKVKGYPAWPAMVLDENILPTNILNKKPKGLKLKANIGKKKKATAPAVILPVRFFSDDTYIWINSNDMSILTNEKIQEYFEASGSKRRKDNLLERAYQLANEPPEMELFVQYGSRAAPPDEPEDIFEDRPQKKPKKAPVVPKISATAERKLEKERQVEAERKLLAEYDSDWGLEEGLEYDVDAGNYIFDSEKEQERVFSKEVPSAQVLQEKVAKMQNKLDKISKKLVDALLRPCEEIVEADVSTQLDLLDHLLSTHFPKSVIMKSKLLRVLILTARIPIENFPRKNIKEQINTILEKRLGINIVINDLSELQKLEDSEKTEEKDEKSSGETENGEANGEENGNHENGELNDEVKLTENDPDQHGEDVKTEH